MATDPLIRYPRRPPPFAAGDRVELVRMDDDPCPKAPGSRGTVESLSYLDFPPRASWQVWVKWDDGGTLALCVPPDVARKIPAEKRCACGHWVAPSLVMTTSRGTSCPDCYDRMSD